MREVDSINIFGQIIEMEAIVPGSTEWKKLQNAYIRIHDKYQNLGMYKDLQKMNQQLLVFLKDVPFRIAVLLRLVRVYNLTNQYDLMENCILELQQYEDQMTSKEKALLKTYEAIRSQYYLRIKEITEAREMMSQRGQIGSEERNRIIELTEEAYSLIETQLDTMEKIDEELIECIKNLIYLYFGISLVSNVELAKARRRRSNYLKRNLYRACKKLYGEEDARTVESKIPCVISREYRENRPERGHYSDTRDVEKLKHAEDTFRRCLRKSSAILGKYNLYVMQLTCELAEVYVGQERIEEAIELYSDLRTSCENVYGPFASNTMLMENNMRTISLAKRKNRCGYLYKIVK